MQTNTAEIIEEKIARARVEYPALWRRLIREWREAKSGNSAWLMYSASYLFFTGRVRWAMDPFSPATRVGGIPHADYAADLEQLELVLLTHAHNDHFDPNLVKAISRLPIQWIVPHFMLEKVKGAGVPGKNIIVPVNGETIEFRGLGITPFAGQHIHGGYGVPETGYLVACAGKRWLFPGDTRVYEPGNLPDAGHVDAVFAHVWLGKKCAALPTPPLLDEFCEYFLAFKAERILLTHLEELGRDESDFWDERHVGIITNNMQGISPTIKICSSHFGGKIELS